MKTIAQTRREGIDWVQEKLDHLPRPLAETTFMSLVEEGILIEDSRGIVLTEEIGADLIRQKGRAAEIRRINGIRMCRRRVCRSAQRSHANHLTHQSRQRSLAWHAPSYTDMIQPDDD